MAHPEHQPRRQRRKSWLRRLLFWGACVVVVLLVAAVIATPWILRAAVPEAFARFGLQASVAGGRLNLLRREVSLEDFNLGPPGAPLLTLGELGVGLELRALMDGRIRLRHVRVKNVSADVEGLLELGKTAGTASGSRQSRLPVELDELDLEDVRLVSLSKRIGHDVRVAHLQVGDLSALANEKKSSVRLQGSVGDGSLDVQLEIWLAQGKLQAVGTYRADALPLRGWARLATRDDDPLSAGTANGRGSVQAEYSIDAEKLDLTLDGRVTAEGLGLKLDRLAFEDGDASWQGRLVLHWSPDVTAPSLRGDGNLDVEDLRATFGGSSRTRTHAAIKDVSWHGTFDWREGFTSEGGIVGARVEVVDASNTEPAWRTRAEDFSSRLHSQAENDSDWFGLRVQDFDMARLFVSVADAEAPVEIAAEKLAFDELRSARLNDVVLGQASADALTITVAGGADGSSVEVNRMTASGLSGDSTGRLHAARLGAESLDYRDGDGDGDRRWRAEGIEFASVGLGAPKRLGADEITIDSARLDEGHGDIWLSGLKVGKAHGDAGGRFGADTVNLTHIFQSGSAEVTWEASGLMLRGVDGDFHDAATLGSVDLGELKVGMDDVSWESAGLHAEQLALTMGGDVNAARFGFEKLERRQPGSGDLGISNFDGRALRREDSRAVLDSASAESVEYRLPDGSEMTTHALEARALTGDLATGLEVSRLTVASGAGHAVDGTTLSASALETHGLSVATSGSIVVDKALLQHFSRTAPDSATLSLDGLDVATLSWKRGGALSTSTAAAEGARFVRSDGVGWTLSALGSDNLGWDGGDRVSADRLTSASFGQSHGQTRDWLARSLAATGIRWELPREVAIATAAADSVYVRNASRVWKVASVAAKGLRSADGDGEKIDSLTSGALTLSDESNAAVLSLERTQADTVKVGILNELSASRLITGRLRLGSRRPDRPSRLSMAELRVANPRLDFGGIVEVDEVVASSPYLIVAQSADNTWMWPPIPGSDAAHAGGQSERGSEGGVRIGRFLTRGPGRIVYIDRATEPAFQLALDPLVVALQNLDTSLPGNRSRFRVRGTSAHLAELTLDGELTKAVHGYDLALDIAVTGAYLPSFNPYIARHEPVAVIAGWGDAHGEFAIENAEVGGRLDVLMSGLELKTTAGGSAFARFDPANFPLRTALALLKDRQGNISISIPFDGRTEDPEYDFIDTFQKDFVRSVTTAGKAVANLPGKTLDAALQLIKSTVSLLPGVNAKRYSPIEFAAGESAIEARPKVYLDQLGDRMVEHDTLVLALCGVSVSREVAIGAPHASGIDKLFDEASEGVYRDYQPGPEGLLSLADARADAVRRYLRDFYGVAGAQLDACDASVDSLPEAKPRVELKVKSPAKRKGLFGILP